MDHKYDVFISYSRKDTPVADQICKAFSQVGITYFIDRQGIGGGMEFPAVLAKAIRESKVFLFLGSKNSYDSKFTQSEIVYAFNKKQKQDIIPYIIDGSSMPDELEFTFSSINWRRLEDHPIDTILVDDVLRKTGKQRPVQPVSSTDEPQPFTPSQPVKSDEGNDEVHIVTRIGLQVITALLYAAIVICPLAMLGGGFPILVLTLLTITTIMAGVAVYLVRRITKGEKKAYYALAAATVVEVLVTAVYDVWLAIGMAMMLGVAFFIFTQLLKIKKNGHSLWAKLK